MSFISEVLVVSGVALDLVGASVLSHSHNAESALELREETGDEERALGEEDAISTHAQLLSEKRIGFLLLAFGLSLHLIGLVLESTEGIVLMAAIAVGMIVLGLATAVIFTRVGGRRVRAHAREVAQSDTEEISDQ